ncbi:L,D-transpeptidase family protein [Solirhodobacter olei]|uniref:L,D-transpeptidase family protein n=1 Tax=Solirhodobacter olei TaxID=2493082 RepID=UPI001F4DEA73|nr:L,D-transpeptidase family protein [Solirhodobacter olei]
MRRHAIDTGLFFAGGSGRRALCGAAIALIGLAGGPAGAQAILAGMAQPAAQGQPAAVQAMMSAFAQGVAAAVSHDRALEEFYRSTDYRPVWTDAADAARRQAFLDALANAGLQGLPAARYDRAGLIAKLRGAETERDRAEAEVSMSRTFLEYARDAWSGVIDPSNIGPGLVLKVDRPDPLALMKGLVAASDPQGYMASLLPQAPQYNALLKEKLTLAHLAATDAWGPPVRAGKLKAGMSGPEVVALRNRLIAMGYLAPSADPSFDADMQAAVMQFQADHGLAPDGVVGPATLEEINVQPIDRLKAVMADMERWRWLPRDLGQKYVWVNLPDFSARVIVGHRVVFDSPVVIGKNTKDTRTPEFSNTMRYMDVNPVWNVPKSIATKEYLPAFQKDPNADSQLVLINQSGQIVDRSTVDFSQYDQNNFPFELKQPPSRDNALGLVKFMFPNRYNIYLHDTPSKYLFKYDRRDFSHGCVRLQKPFDLAYLLLGWQNPDPKAEFQRALATKDQQTIDLKSPLPVHLVYFTAIPSLTGHMQYRRDIYGRDGRIFAALQQAGVALPGDPH